MGQGGLEEAPLRLNDEQHDYLGPLLSRLQSLVTGDVLGIRELGTECGDDRCIGPPQDES